MSGGGERVVTILLGKFNSLRSGKVTDNMHL